VSIIEPGGVKTPIWAKTGSEAAQALADLPPRARELYGQQLEGMNRTGEKTGERGTAPAKVVAAIEHALTAPHPRTRYVVGAMRACSSRSRRSCRTPCWTAWSRASPARADVHR